MSTLIPTEADTMFLTGYRGSMCEEPLSCVYTYAAGEIEPWSPYLNDWPGAPGDYVGYVVPFQGSYYMSGLFTNTQTGEYYGLQRYTAGVWEPVPGFEGYAPIREILVHENRLYIAGFFFEAQGAPGNGVAAFDGSTWDRLGGGIGATQDNPVGNTTMVNDLLFHEHELYVSGRFEYAGGIAAQNIARWNGVQWCSFGSVFEPPNYLKMDVWHDDLYVVGGFDAIDGEPINGIAHWLGGSYVAACGDAIGVAEVDATPMVSLQYGADRGVFEIVCSVQELIQVTIHDAMGRATLSVTRTPSRAVSVDLSGNAPGMYLARCTLQDGRSITLRLVR